MNINIINKPAIRVVFLLLLALTVSAAADAGSLVSGIIYLKTGEVIECSEKDRIELPKGFKSVRLYRNAFYKNKSKEIYKIETVDSIVCWNASSPDYLRKFVPSKQIGWLWVYLETPHICVGVYSKKGYGIGINGGIEIWVVQRNLSRSASAYYLRKTGDTEFHDVGSASRNVKNVFRRRIAEYISDDPELAGRILGAECGRSKTILMLKEYNPERTEGSPDAGNF